MFRIRRISDGSTPLDRRELAEVQRLLRDRFPGIPDSEVETLPSRLLDPMKHRFHARLYVADDRRGDVKGFALLLHAPDPGFCYLDYIATGRSLTRTGVGAALYARVRAVAAELGASGLYFECLPDEKEQCSKPESARENAARLRFYERFGAFPIVGTAYETPLSPGDLDMPHLVYDDLDTGRPPSRAQLKQTVRAILERKYGHLCSPDYVETVVSSIRDDPVGLRPRVHTRASEAPVPDAPRGEEVVVLVVNDKHDIHHVRERGYVQAPIRVKTILEGLSHENCFLPTTVKAHPEAAIRAVHDADFVDYLKAACAKIPAEKSVYPYVFPIRNAARPPKDLAVRAGYYCIDTFTPLNLNAWLAARRAVDCALTAADALRDGQRFAYALVRPPGHHAEKRSFGGFCYLNNAAVAAHHLAQFGRVAILDLDYHHGNGQQDIFYARDDVLTVSIHGDPSFAYPYFTGFADERGEGAGEGFNLNLPLPETIERRRYTAALEQVLARIAEFAPRFVVLCLGFDTGKGDPTGTWTLLPEDFEANARRVRALGLPVLVVQEGGYRTRSLGTNARAFFRGLVGAPERAGVQA